MPPKKKPEAKKSTQDKAKAKVVEDKTFGLKNKKGKKQQQFIKTVNSQVQGNQKKNDENTTKLSKREIERKKLEELNDLFKPVQESQKVAAGVDPKSVLCSFFKQGHCGKGAKCKFSHDLSLDRKAEKRSVYDDERDDKGTMEEWDQETLESVVNKKHGATNTVKTEIVCKYFLEAIEKNLYGWFWNCPNGNSCMYRHALPPGFVLKRDKKEESEEEKISLEELIENERNNLKGDLTPVTLETFLAWKKKKIADKKDKYNKDMSKKKEEFKAGKAFSKISGKEVFMFKPELADADDDEATDDPNLDRREEQEEVDDQPITEIDINQFSKATSMAHVDNSKVTRVTSLLAKDRDKSMTSSSSTSANMTHPKNHTDQNGLDQACAPDEGPPKDVVIDGVPVDESLFEDLDDLDIED